MAANGLDKINEVLEDYITRQVACWCTWDRSWLPLSHEEFCVANDYPPHDVSPHWNLPEPEPGYADWDGRSDDAADSTADDIDQSAPCYLCGWDPDYSDGLAHDARYQQNSHAEPHEYVPGPQETGEVVVSLTGAYELDGVARCPGGSTDDQDQPQWGLYKYCQWTQDGEEGFLDLVADDLTVQGAIDLAAKLGYGWPLGV